MSKNIVLRGRPSIAIMQRCYIKGAKLDFCCPKCGSKIFRDYGVDYITYPEPERPIGQNFYCHNCGVDIAVKVRLTDVEINMEFDLDHMKVEG